MGSRMAYPLTHTHTRPHTPLCPWSRYLQNPGALTRASAVTVADAQVVDGAIEQHRRTVEARSVCGLVALRIVTEQELADDGRLAHARGAQHGHPQAAPHGPRPLLRSLMGRRRAVRPARPAPCSPAPLLSSSPREHPGPGEARPENWAGSGRAEGQSRRLTADARAAPGMPKLGENRPGAPRADASSTPQRDWRRRGQPRAPRSDLLAARVPQRSGAELGGQQCLSATRFLRLSLALAPGVAAPAGGASERAEQSLPEAAMR